MKNIIKGFICAALVGVMAIAAVGCSAEVTVPNWIAQLSCSHENWDEGEVTKGATCTEAGELTLTCEDCGKTKTEEIEVLEHDAVLLYEKMPTCETEGENMYECNDCGKIWKEVVEKSAHTFGDDKTCDVCEYVETETDTETETETEEAGV